MASSTALQLVNRCLRRLRKNTVADATTFSSREAVDLLEYVNEAKCDVLETRIWDFDRRQDTLNVFGQITPTTLAVANTGADAIDVLFTAAGGDVATTTMNGNFVTRAVITSDSAFGDTSFRLDSAAAAGATVACRWNEPWPGTTDGAGTGYLFIAEYLIEKHAETSDTDAKYRQILSVWHQERELQLIQAEKDVSFDGFVQRLHQSIGTDPTTVMVGGRAQATRLDVNATETDGDVMVVWPVPSSDMVLDFTAVYRHPLLAIPEDTLEDVPLPVENVIVSLATALWMQGPGKAVQEGVLLERRTRSRIEDVWHGTRKAPLKRNALLSLDAVSRDVATDFGRIPRNVGSL